MSVATRAQSRAGKKPRPLSVGMKEETARPEWWDIPWEARQETWLDYRKAVGVQGGIP